METSQIVEWYAGKSVFMTGATGLVGKGLLEKLLRSCSNIKKIYVLVRSKKGSTAEERVDNIIDCPVMKRKSL